MLVDLSKYEKYLEDTDGAVGKVKKDAPPKVVEELKKVNRDYKKYYGDTLIKF